MDLIELKNSIAEAYCGPDDQLQELLATMQDENSIYPFNEYEHLIASMLHDGGLTYEQYVELREQYIRCNPNLWLFEISAPRAFGESFAQTFVRNKSSLFVPPSKKLDKNYVGQYDLWLDGIRIEVKASRAVDQQSSAPLYVKALSRASKSPFLMNFQQLKPQCCDVFIWVAVFRDQIVLWVMSANEVTALPQYSIGQHRGNKGNEGQFHLTDQNISQLSPFELLSDDIVGVVRSAAQRQRLGQ